MFTGLRPAANISSTNPNQYRDWHRLTLLTDEVINVGANSLSDVMTDDTVAWNAASVKHKTNFTRFQSERILYPKYTQTIDNLQLQAHGINIFQQYNTPFFRDYLPYTFGGVNIVTAEDPGAMMLNFCLYPGTYQPSGHINVSRAREFYLQFVSSFCGSLSPCDLLTLNRRNSRSASSVKQATAVILITDKQCNRLVACIA